MKNLIYIVAIEDIDSKVSVPEYFEYAESTWRHYCDRHGIDLVIEKECNFHGKIKPIWNKSLIYLKEGYDKIGIVDADTMIRWDAPNIFEEFDDEFCGVKDLCDLNWLLSSIQDRQKFFPEVNMDIFKYINAGVVFFNDKHKDVFKELLDFYIANKREIDAIQGGGKEQTLLNFFLQKNQIPIKLLDPRWNLVSIHRKNMFIPNWQLKLDSTPHFIKYSYIWHFTGFPIERRVEMMRNVWNATKPNYQ